MSQFFNFIYRKTLRSVLFGVTIMVLIALYIAIGSGVARVREAFEMNELQFFSAWPLKVLMLLLVANLATVTWTRIPFTPPRYGVWCVHAGIITLIVGMALYYNRKVEGMTRIWVDAREGPTTVEHYYDAAERALYVKFNDELANWEPLPSLPRFKSYEKLDLKELKGIEPYLLVQEGSGEPVKRPLSEILKLSAPIKIDITGYWPYAHLSTKYVEDPAVNNTGLRMSLAQGHAGGDFEAWLVSGDRRAASTMLGEMEMEHRHVSAATAGILREAATKVHRLGIRRGNFSQTLDVQIGQSYPLGDTGYTIRIEDYKPSWSMFGTAERVRALTLHVKSPTQEFRRMVLDGKDVQTDFLLNVEGAGPMGKRQKEPLDKELIVQYRLDDPYRLTPRQGSEKHTLLTSDGATGVTDIVSSVSAATEVREAPSGEAEVKLAESMALKLERKDHLRREDRVEPVPPAKRSRDAGEAGVFQVVRAKISVGDWSRETLVPFADETADTRLWEGEAIQLPGSTATIQLQLGKTRRTLPAKLTLKNFDLVPYAGGDETRRSVMRDFRSTLVIEDRDNGEQVTEVARMNNPVYFDNGRWLFFQAAYDGQERKWTVLGVGNRPGVWIMTTGCVMIFLGVVYAFYVKPIIVRRMKEKALAAAANAKRPANVKPPAAAEIAPGALPSSTG